MYPRRMVSQKLRLGLLVTLVILALSSCGGGAEGSQDEEAKGLPLPQDPKPCVPTNTTQLSSSPRSPSGSARAGQTSKRSCPTLSRWVRWSTTRR